MEPAPRISSWLLIPLAWLLVIILYKGVAMASLLSLLTRPAFRNMLFTDNINLALLLSTSLIASLLTLVYSMWVAWLFCKRSRRLPRHYIFWLLLLLLLAVKNFVLTSVGNVTATKTLLIYLLAAAILIPYFKRSQRVKNTFIIP